MNLKLLKHVYANKLIFKKSSGDVGVSLGLKTGNENNYMNPISVAKANHLTLDFILPGVKWDLANGYDKD